MLVFKVGICMDPNERWRNDEFGGYAAERMWMCLDIIFSGPAESRRQLEIQLIRAVRRVPGCYNVKPGGEGMQRGSLLPCFAYFALAPCGDGVSPEVAYELRVRERWGKEVSRQEGGRTRGR